MHALRQDWIKGKVPMSASQKVIDAINEPAFAKAAARQADRFAFV
jgi:hypothetical protein